MKKKLEKPVVTKQEVSEVKTKGPSANRRPVNAPAVYNPEIPENKQREFR